MLIIELSLPREDERVAQAKDLLALLTAVADDAAARATLGWLAEHRAPRRWRRVWIERAEAVLDVRHAASSTHGRRAADRSTVGKRIASSDWTKWRFEWDDATPDLQHRAQLDELCIRATRRAAANPWHRRFRLRLRGPRSATLPLDDVDLPPNQTRWPVTCGEGSRRSSEVSASAATPLPSRRPVPIGDGCVSGGLGGCTEKDM